MSGALYLHGHICPRRTLMQRGRRTIPLATLIASITAILCLGGGTNFNGSYKITFAGALTGDGNAAVGANNVNINAPQLKDAYGNDAHLIAPGLDLTNGRFNGTGTFNGQTCQISGRVEAPDNQTLFVARFSALITLADGPHGRAIGSR